MADAEIVSRGRNEMIKPLRRNSRVKKTKFKYESGIPGMAEYRDQKGAACRNAFPNLTNFPIFNKKTHYAIT